MREPFISLNSGGKNLIPIWGPLLIEVLVSDEKGVESDKLTVTLDDTDGQCSYPGTGQIVTIDGGYVGEGPRVQGEFEIDQVDFEGWPQKIILHGTPVSAKKATKERKTEAHKKEDTKTFGDLAGKIAKRNGWKPQIAADLSKLEIEYEGQAGEFDAQFLTRVAKRFGGIVSVKQGNLVVTKAAGGKSASGKSMTPVVVSPGLNLISYRVSLKKRPDHGKAQAHTFDRKKVERVDTKAGSGEITYKLREPFKTKKEADLAAESKLSELARGTGSATFEIEGDPTAKAEAPVTARGIRSKVDGAWNSIRVEHRWDDSGYRTTLECEAPESKTKDSGGDA